MNQENSVIEEFTSSNISKFWNLLNYSNDISKKQVANIFFSNLKEKCQNYLEISIELFNNSDSKQDKLISSILIYQYIKENYIKFIENEILFNGIKDFLINKVLISYINKEDFDVFSNSEDSLIIERICFSISVIIILGCFTYWPESVNDMLGFSKFSIKHTYLTSIIFGNCNEELCDMYLNKSQENKIKEKFVKNKDNFKIFINTILTNSNINKKLYNKTILLSKNLVIFEINILHIPNMIKILFENANKSNIDSLSKLISKCIDYSNCKKLEDDLCGLDLDEYEKKMNKDELISINLIIESIYICINNCNNKNEDEEKDMIFGFGKILAEIIENYIYLMFKKDNISQKLLNLFFFFICNKYRVISQLFFESVLIMKNFINACYKFNNYSKDEKVEFSAFLLKICQNIIINCTYKKIENQEILLKNENICINHNKNDENIIKDNNNSNDKDDYSLEEKIDEIPINEYRAYAEDTFFNIFLIFATNFLNEGANYFFETITNPIIPLLSKNVSDISITQILSIESIIYSIKSIINSFDTLIVDKAPLIHFISLIIKSNVIKYDFIYVNFLLLIEEASTFFDYNKNIYEEIINFIIDNINIRINDNNKETLVQLSTAVLLSICETCRNFYDKNLWEKMFLAYNNYYNLYTEISLYNMTESICSFLISQDEEEDIIINNIDLINCFNKIIEIPLIYIKNINEIIVNKKDRNSLIEKEKLLKKAIIKNINILTRILKQISFIKDKSIFNLFFNSMYSTSFSFIYNIIQEYISCCDIVTPFLKMLTKSSVYLTYETVNKIFLNLNQFLIEIFMKNNENYQSIYVLKNLYMIKLKNMDNMEKSINNNEYILILDNFVGLNRQICSCIINRMCPQYQIELIQSLSMMFNYVFPFIKELRNSDYIIICDSIIIFIEGIKAICENNVIKNILISFSSLIKNAKDDLIKLKFKDIILACFYSLDHYNNVVINSFITFCFDCLNYDKASFLLIFNQILLSDDYKFLNNKYKNVVFEYFDYYFNDINKLKNIIIDLMNVSKKINTQDILEEYHIELKNKKNDFFNF